MKRFVFHLQPLLKLRGHVEEEWRLKLGEASQLCNSLKQQILTMEKERVSVFSHDLSVDGESAPESRDGTAVLSLAGYQYSRALYLGRIEDRTRQLQTELVEAEKAREEVLEKYRVVRREYDAVVKIREKKFAEHRKEWFSAEGKEMDDIANSRFAGGLHGEV